MAGRRNPPRPRTKGRRVGAPLIPSGRKNVGELEDELELPPPSPPLLFVVEVIVGEIVKGTPPPSGAECAAGGLGDRRGRRMGAA